MERLNFSPKCTIHGCTLHLVYVFPNCGNKGELKSASCPECVAAINKSKDGYEQLSSQSYPINWELRNTRMMRDAAERREGRLKEANCELKTEIEELKDKLAKMAIANSTDLIANMRAEFNKQNNAIEARADLKMALNRWREEVALADVHKNSGLLDNVVDAILRVTGNE